jgi:hypothetical protein
VKILQLALAVAVSAFALTACEPELQWHDATGQHRGRDQLQSDARACIEEVRADPKTGIDSEHQEAWENCLHGKGWAPNGKAP